MDHSYLLQKNLFFKTNYKNLKLNFQNQTLSFLSHMYPSVVSPLWMLTPFSCFWQKPWCNTLPFLYFTSDIYKYLYLSCESDFNSLLIQLGSLPCNFSSLTDPRNVTFHFIQLFVFVRIEVISPKLFMCQSWHQNFFNNVCILGSDHLDSSAKFFLPVFPSSLLSSSLLPLSFSQTRNLTSIFW